MTAIKILAFLILSAIIAGCSTMTVDVRIMNREYLDALPALAGRVQSTEASVRTKLVSNEFAAKEKKLLGLIDLWESKQLPIGPLGEQFKADCKAAVILQFSKAKELYGEAIDAAGTARAAPDVKPKEGQLGNSEIGKNKSSELLLDKREAYAIAASKFRAADAALLELPAIVGELLATFGVSGPLDNNVSASAVVEREVMGLIGGHGLFEDTLASIIVGAPECQWTGKFNNAHAFGGLGNTDIAVVMQGLGDFTLKGVRVDASKVTSAAFDAVGSTIKIVAAVYGVPIGSGGGSVASSTGNTSAGSADAELLAADQARVAADLKLQRQKRAFADILRAIVREKANMVDQAAQNEAIKRIRSAFEINIKVLPKSTTPAS